MTESKVTKFQSPVPVILRLRDFIFGKKEPDVITKITFYINLTLWGTFMLWSLISFYTINAREFFYEQKHIAVESIIKARGEELGFEGADFLSRLLILNGLGILCWSVVFVGLVLIFRQKKIFFNFFLSPILFYLAVLLLYIGPSYFMQDTTAFDKISLLIMLTSGSIFYFLIKNKKKEDEELNFFSIDEDE